MNNTIKSSEVNNDARREGFIEAKRAKEQGKKIVGMFCTYSPIEVIYAAGAFPVSLCGGPDGKIQEAESHLPQNLCPLIKSSYGNALTDSCPYFYFSDLVIGETTCDGKKKMYELLGRLKDVHVMHLPQGQDREQDLAYWKKEILDLIHVLEKKFSCEITPDKLHQAIIQRNKERRILLDFFELGQLKPSPISGFEIDSGIESVEFSFDLDQAYGDIQKRTAEVKAYYNQELKGKASSRPRILLTGCPTGGVRHKVVKRLEDLGADVVAFENCSGPKEKMKLVDENKDPLEAIAEKYLNINCSVMSPNPNRLVSLSQMIDEYQVDGVVEVILQACHTFNIESYSVKEFVVKEKNLPYMRVETDYSPHDEGQLGTRFNAFIEMISY